MNYSKRNIWKLSMEWYIWNLEIVNEWIGKVWNPMNKKFDTLQKEVYNYIILKSFTNSIAKKDYKNKIKSYVTEN